MSSVLTMTNIKLPFSYEKHERTPTSILFSRVTFTEDVTIEEEEKTITKGSKFENLAAFIGWRIDVEEEKLIFDGEVTGINILIVDTRGSGAVFWEYLPIPKLKVNINDLGSDTLGNPTSIESVKISDQLTYPRKTKFKEVSSNLSIGEGQTLVIDVKYEI